MAQARAARKSGGKTESGWAGSVLRGAFIAILCTVCGVIICALLMQWITLSDGVVRVFNQVLKIASVCVGVLRAVPRGGQTGLVRGALVGLVYMGLGVVVYALLSGQSLLITAYLADIAMGVASGGLMGMLRANMKSST